MEAGLGRFGPYVRMGSVFASLDADDDVLVVGMNRAVEVLAKKLASVRSLGPHPKDQEGVTVRKGRFGPYAQHGTTVATLSRGVAMEEITLEEAVALLAERGKQLAPRGAKGKKARGGKAPAVKVAAVKAAPAAKPAAKTPAAKKKAPVKKTPAVKRKAAG
jgi:DNA topoisomerase-1